MDGFGFVKLTVERVTQVDLVPQGVAQLDANEFTVPRPLYVLLPVALGIGICFEGKLGPDSIFT